MNLSFLKRLKHYQYCFSKWANGLKYKCLLQANWERRILKSMNSMCTELSIPLARKRPADEQRELLHKWNEMGTDEPGTHSFKCLPQ